MINRLLGCMMLSVALVSCGKSDTHQYQGYIEGENTYLSSPVSGTIVEVNVIRGQAVKAGDLLFKLDENPQVLEVAGAAASLLQAQQTLNDLLKPRRAPEINAIIAQIDQTNSQIALAKLRVDRYQTLYEKHVVAKDNLDQSVQKYQELQQTKAQFEANLALAKLGGRSNQIDAQKAQVDSLTSKLKEAQWQLTKKHIYAPEDGIIFDTYYRLGEYFDEKKAIAALLTPANLRLEFFVPVSELSAIHLGQQISFDCDGCAPHNLATIQYISPEPEYTPPLIYSRDNMNKLVFRIKAKLADPIKFKPGQPALVSVKNDG